MPVKKSEDDIIIRIPRKYFTSEVRNMLNLIRHKKIVSASKASEKEIVKIEMTMKKQRSNDVRALLLQRGLLPG